MQNFLHSVSIGFLTGLLAIQALSPRTAMSPQDLQGDREYGITLYEQKNYQEASAILQHAVRVHKNDLTAWHYLGLTLEELGLIHEASQAHRTAAKLGASLVLDEVKKGSSWISKLEPDKTRVKQAEVSADRYIRLSKLNRSEFDEWTERLTSLRELSEIEDSIGDVSRRVYLGKEVTTKARVLDVPPPEYGPGENVQMTIVLRGVFGADGKVRTAFPLDVDSYGDFALSCIKAARKIKFIPAVKDGKPVAMYMEFQYASNR